MLLSTTTLTLITFPILFLLLSHIFTYLRTRTFIALHGCKPPQNIIWTNEPLLGLDLMLTSVRKARTGFYIRFLASRYFSYRKPGGTYTYVTKRLTYSTIQTADPENLKYMLATGFENYKLATLRVNAMTPLFGKGIFTSDGPMWAHSRAILRPSFTKQNMAPLLAMMERHFQMLLKVVPRDGKVFDLQEIFFRFTMDTATEFLMGGSTHTLDEERESEAERKFVESYMTSCYEAVRQIAFGKLQFLSRTPKGLDEAKRQAKEYVDRFVDEALARREKRKTRKEEEVEEDGVEYNFLEELAGQTENRVLLRDQVLNVLLASRDTTAALLSNMFYQLARKPEIYAKLRREVLAGMEGELPTEAEMSNMTFLRWCINEALRMYPVVPGNTRESVVDTILPVGGGHDGKSPIFVPKGTPVMYNLRALHYRKDIYGENVDDFNPDRWDGLRPGWGFLPFNGGPRICLGQNFALTEASYVTVRMLQSFEKLEAHDDRIWMEQYSLVMCSKNGVLVSVKTAS